MILFSHKTGQLGNRLFTFAHLIANAAANDTKLINLSFDEYARHFHTTSQDVLCRYPSVKSAIKSNWIRSALLWLNRAILKFLRGINFHQSAFHSIVIADLPTYKFGENRYFELAKEDFQNTVKQRAIVFLFGRFFRDYTNFEKYQDVIRNFFKPNSEIQNNVDRFMKKSRQNTDLIIGVHIRRGDYAEFAGGKYFYTQKNYYSKMEQLQRALPSKKIKFVICSNEKINPEFFEGVDFLIGPGHLVEDLYALSECDLIMGPPSTYSTWASFYGGKPIYQIKDLDISPTLENFVILPSHLLYNF